MVDIISDDYKKKMKVIKRFLPNSAIKKLFDTNFCVLNTNLVLSFNYFALGIRSIIDKTLSTIAPDKKIKETNWYCDFCYDEHTTTGVTTKQRLAYILCGEHSVTAVDVVFPIVEGIEKLYKEYRELNKLVHLNSIPDSSEWKEKTERIIDVVFDFVENFNHIDTQLELIFNNMTTAILDYMEEDGYTDALDSIATHFTDPDTDIKKMIIQKIEECEDEFGKRYLIRMNLIGTIDAQFQFGSNSDVRRGDGLVWRESFPLNVIALLTMGVDGDTLYPWSIEWNRVEAEVDYDELHN